MTNRAPSKDEFCLAGIVTRKCGGKEFTENEYCGKANDGKTDSIYTYCDNAYDGRLVETYSIIGWSILPSEEDDVEVTSSSFFGDLIGPKLDNFTTDELEMFFDALEELRAKRCQTED